MELFLYGYMAGLITAGALYLAWYFAPLGPIR